MNTLCANDTTEPTTILRGTTYEGAAWRAHRYSDSFRVTSLLNAGKRGKACEVFTVCAPMGNSEEHMDSVAPAILWAAREGASVDTMRAMLADLARNTRTGEDGPTCKTYVGARRSWYRRGGRAAGWRIFDATGNNVSP